MSSGLLGIGTSGLNAAQRALATTGHNIANINTDGYSRQRAQFATLPAQYSGSGYVGNGARVTTIERMYDEFIQGQLRTTTTSSNYFSTAHGFFSRVDNLLADPSAGLSPGLQNFFASVQQLGNDPTSSANRTVLISEAESLVDRFKFLNQNLRDQQAIVDGQIGTVVSEINSLTASIADLNMQIVNAQGRGQPPNDLLDQRDQLVLELSRFVDVSTVMQDDGSMSVFIGKGQAVVLGNRSTALDAVSSVPGMPLEIRYGTGSGSVDITRQMSGGTLGALLDVRTVLDETQNELGRVAVTMTIAFNNQHRLGLDLNGDLGGDFFTIADPEVLVGSGTVSGKPLVQFDQAGLAGLTANDYRLTFDGTDWQLSRQPGGASVPLPPPDADGWVRVDGLKIQLPDPATVVEGDNFLIRPTRGAAQGINVAITQPEKLAAATAIITTPDAGNTGNAQVQSLSAVDASAFSTWFMDDTSGDLVFGATDFEQISTGVWRAEIEGVEMILSGEPQAGDTFTVSKNDNFGVGDNRNALALSLVQSTNYLDSGRTSIEGAYNSLIGQVGTMTRQAEVAAKAQAQLLADAWAQRESISGVNLDEEAANLLRFQQAYQASAQIIAVTNTLFDTLIGVVRR